MENATKALLIAAGVLIGIIILSMFATSITYQLSGICKLFSINEQVRDFV